MTGSCILSLLTVHRTVVGEVPAFIGSKAVLNSPRSLQNDPVDFAGKKRNSHCSPAPKQGVLKDSRKRCIQTGKVFKGSTVEYKKVKVLVSSLRTMLDIGTWTCRATNGFFAFLPRRFRLSIAVILFPLFFGLL